MTEPDDTSPPAPGLSAAEDAPRKRRRVEDPDLLRDLDEEFAELEKEIERVALLAPTKPQDTLSQLHQLRKLWEEKLPKDPNQPEWKKRLDKAFADAIERVLVKSAHMNTDGTMSMKIDPSVFKSATGNLLTEIVQALYLKFTTPAPAPPKPAGVSTKRGPAKRKRKKPATSAGEAGDDSGGAKTAQVRSLGRAQTEIVPPPVQVKLDVGSLLARLLQRPLTTPDSSAPVPQAAPAAAAPAPQENVGPDAATPLESPGEATTPGGSIPRGTTPGDEPPE